MSRRQDRKNLFVHVGPRLSMTARQCGPLGIGASGRRALCGARPSAHASAGKARQAAKRSGNPERYFCLYPAGGGREDRGEGERPDGPRAAHFPGPGGPSRLRREWHFRTRPPSRRPLPPTSCAPFGRKQGAPRFFERDLPRPGRACLRDEGAHGPHGGRRGRRSGLLPGQPRVQPACFLGI